MKLFSNEESAAKPGCAQFKEAAPQVRLSCPDDNSILHDGKSVPKDLLQLSQLVGNPSTEESVWMNACIGAGNRSLAPKHGLVYKTLMSFKTSLGMTSIMLTLVLNFVLLLFIAGHSAFLSLGTTVDDFIRPFAQMDGAGLVIALMASTSFWGALLSKSSVLKWFYLIISMLGLSLTLVFGVSDFLSFGWALATAAISMLSVAGLWYGGALCREALPRSFSADKVVQSSFSMLALPASLSAWILYNAFSSTTHTSSYDNGNSTTLWVLCTIVGYGVLGQGYAIGRASKSASKAACAFLGVCVQAPMLLGLVYIVGVSVLVGARANFDANFVSVQSILNSSFLAAWANLGAQRAGFMLAATLMTFGLAGAGGYLGAWRNSIASKRK
ncbi:MAG: hypothetical protein JST89_08680 [Cyanobacteria bacterium SZAS-4]|nr:hypothetical protein [Cyanobacteria bacterium SZAS-4]